MHHTIRYLRTLKEKYDIGNDYIAKKRAEPFLSVKEYLIAERLTDKSLRICVKLVEALDLIGVDMGNDFKDKILKGLYGQSNKFLGVIEKAEKLNMSKYLEILNARISLKDITYIINLQQST